MPKRTKTARLTYDQLNTLVRLVWSGRASLSTSWKHRRHYERLVKLGMASGKVRPSPLIDPIWDYRPTPAGRAHVRRCCVVEVRS